MKTYPITYTPKSTGILQEYRKAHNNLYMRGLYRGHNIEVFEDLKDKNKLIYVSDPALNWVKSKFTYFHNGVKKIMRKEAF